MREFICALLAATAVTIYPLAAQPEQSELPSAAEITADCDRRVTCGELNSCAKACGFYQQCNRKTLDRDDDGIPCETICDRACDTPS